jgi:hypothetical protein
MTKLEVPGPDWATASQIFVASPSIVHALVTLPGQFKNSRSHYSCPRGLFYVREGLLQLIPALIPANLTNTFQPDAHFWITAVARGIDGESNTLRLKVDWDGTWESGDTEMSRHLRIKSVEPL